MKKPVSVLKGVIGFYLEGFRNMPDWGRKVWLIILIKLFIMFAILRIFFFQDFLFTNFHNSKERSEHVVDQLINPSNRNDR